MTFKLEKSRCGSIDGCVPYIAEYFGNDDIDSLLAGSVNTHYWKSCNTNTISKNGLLAVMYVKYINFNFNLNNSIDLSVLGINRKNDRPLFSCHICGLILRDKLYLEGNYNSNSEINYDFMDNDQISTNGFKLKGCDIIGRFDVLNCCYYVDLAD